MVIVAFVAFFALVLCWLLAPTDGERPDEAPAARPAANAVARAAPGAVRLHS